MVDGDNWLYASDYGVNEEGLTAMLTASDAHDIQTMVEGATLLKNDTGALPLTAEETRVTLFGRASADPVYRGNSGGPRSTGIEISGENSTEFAGDLDYVGISLPGPAIGWASAPCNFTASIDAVGAGVSPAGTTRAASCPWSLDSPCGKPPGY